MRHHRCRQQVTIESLEGRRLLSVTVDAATFVYATAPHAVKLDFNSDVQWSLSASDVHLENLFTTQSISTLLSYGAGDIATFSVTGLGNGILPDGNYQATIFADSVRNTSLESLANDFELEFFVLAGDINHDRYTNANDFTILASNFGHPGTYAQGDLNYDGMVNANDFTILASNFGAHVAPAPSPGELGISQGAGQIALSWNWPNLPLDIDGFRIQRSTDGQNFSTYATLLGRDHASFVDDNDGAGLAPGTRYWYRVRAFGGTTGGTQYTPKQGGNTVMPVPLNPAAMATENEITVTWTEATTNATSYDVELGLPSGAKQVFRQVSSDAAAPGFVIPDLWQDTSYEIRIRAWGPAMDSAWSSPITVRTLPPLNNIPAPTGVTATMLHSGSLNLGWQRNALDFQFYSYVWQTAPSPDGPWSGSSVLFNMFSVTLAQPAQGTTQYYRVLTASGSEQSRPSSVVRVTVPTLTVSAPIGASTASLSWTFPYEDAQKFNILQSTSDAPWEVVEQVDGTQRSIIVSGLPEGGTSQFRVEAITRTSRTWDAGNASVFTQPLAPTDFHIEMVTPGLAKLLWTDNSALNTRYEVINSTTGSLVLGRNIPELQEASLAGSQSSNTYAIVAVTSGARSTPSNPVTITFGTPPPSLPAVTISGPSAMTEGGPAPTFTLTRSGNMTPAINVEIYVPGGTANIGEDVQSPPITVPIASGVATATFTLGALEDFVREPVETLWLGIRAAPTYFTSIVGTIMTLIVDDGKGVELELWNGKDLGGGKGTKIAPKLVNGQEENEDHDAQQAETGGSEALGAYAMGDGRLEDPGEVYTFVNMVVGKVNLPAPVPSLRWRRTVQHRGWAATKLGNEWHVFQDPQLRTGFPVPTEDHGADAGNDATPSADNNIYMFDNSAINLADNAKGMEIGDVLRMEKQFLYVVEAQDANGGWAKIAELKVAQVIEVERFAKTGHVAQDFKGRRHSMEVGTIDLKVTTQEIRDLVGGNDQIILEQGINQ